MGAQKKKSRAAAGDSVGGSTALREVAGPSQRGVQRLFIVLMVIIAAVTLAALGRVVQNGFVDFDDTPYVARNPVISQGLTLKGLVYAVTDMSLANWHPVTFISHMIDCQVYGLRAWGHHLTNLLLHVANTCLLMTLLRRMAGSVWRSAIVAALFAVHPLHVQSVAWVAERKDMLSALFAFLCLHSYVTYVRGGGRRAYGFMALWLTLSLMSKAMFVTLPFLMLVLDWWPLRRFGAAPQPGNLIANTLPPKDQSAACDSDSTAKRQRPALSALILEKLPLLALCGAAAILAMISQRHGGAMVTTDSMPLTARLANAVVAYATYLRQMVWPRNLCVLYPLPKGIWLGDVLPAAAVLLVMTVAAIALRRKLPAWLAGWLWFVGLLVPVIGLVQIGAQSHADRYTYVPLVGVFIMLLFGAPLSLLRMFADRPAWRMVGGIAVVAVVGTLAVAANKEAGYWKDSRTLFERCLALTEDNYVIRSNLGLVLQQSGDHAGALRELDEALRVHPEYAEGHVFMGITYNKMGRYAEAIPCFERALALRPKFPEAHVNWGASLHGIGQVGEARHHYDVALEQDPDQAMALANLGLIMAEQGDPAGAIDLYRRALAQEETADTWNNLGLAYMAQQQGAPAEEAFRNALKLDENHEGAAVNLGQALGAIGRVQEAADWLRQVVQRYPGNQQAKQLLQWAEEDLGMSR